VLVLCDSYATFNAHLSSTLSSFNVSFILVLILHSLVLYIYILILVRLTHCMHIFFSINVKEKAFEDVQYELKLLGENNLRFKARVCFRTFHSYIFFKCSSEILVYVIFKCVC